MPGSVRGAITSQNATVRLAPSTIAASSSSFGRLRVLGALVGVLERSLS